MKISFTLLLLALAANLFAQSELKKNVNGTIIPAGIPWQPDTLVILDGQVSNQKHINKMKAEDIAEIIYLKDSIQIGCRRNDGVFLVTTKKAATQRYWEILKSRSRKYASVVRSPGEDSHIAYFINDTLLIDKRQLLTMDSKKLIGVQVVPTNDLRNSPGINDKSYVVMIQYMRPVKLYTPPPNKL